MPLQYFDGATEDFDSLVRKFSSWKADYSTLNTEIKRSVESLIKMRPNIIKIANHPKTDYLDKRKVVDTYNALRDLSRQNIITLPQMTAKQYSGPNLPPHIRVVEGKFAGLGVLQIPVVAAGVAAISIVVISLAHYRAKTVTSREKTKQMELWSKMPASQMASYVAGPGAPPPEEPPITPGVDILYWAKKFAPWGIAGLAAWYLLPVVSQMFTKKQ